MKHDIARKMLKQNVDDFAAKNMQDFGTYTIKHRAVCDYRDGLKPVQRRIIWAAYKMGVNSRSGTKKTARIYGEVIGKYHPHGDASVDQAITNMISNPSFNMGDNCPRPVLYGQGNFGPINTKAADGRYSEMRLHKYTDEVLLNSSYINTAVTDMISNYDGEEVEPVVLPALLPHLLLNGTTGITVGTIAGIPAFEPNGVIKLLKEVLEGKQVMAKQCAKYLKVKYQYNETLLNEPELIEFYKTGIGNLRMGVTYQTEGSHMIITGGPPSFNVEKASERLKNDARVISTDDYSCNEEPIKLVVTLKTSVSADERREVFRELAGKLNQTIPLRMNVLESKFDKSKTFDDEDVTFHTNWSMPKFFEKWTEWRVELEQRAQQNIINELTSELFRLETLVFACDNLDKIVKVLKSKTKTLDEDLAKALKINLDKSKIILAMTVRALSALSKTDIQKRIAEKRSLKAQAEKHYKHPNKKVLADLPVLEVVLFGKQSKSGK